MGESLVEECSQLAFNAGLDAFEAGRFQFCNPG